MSSISATGRSFKLALIQLSVGANKAANLSRAVQKVEEAAKKGAQVFKTLQFLFQSVWHNQVLIKIGISS